MTADLNQGGPVQVEDAIPGFNLNGAGNESWIVPVQQNQRACFPQGQVLQFQIKLLIDFRSTFQVECGLRCDVQAVCEREGLRSMCEVQCLNRNGKHAVLNVDLAAVPLLRIEGAPVNGTVIWSWGGCCSRIELREAAAFDVQALGRDSQQGGRQ